MAEPVGFFIDGVIASKDGTNTNPIGNTNGLPSTVVIATTSVGATRTDDAIVHIGGRHSSRIRIGYDSSGDMVWSNWGGTLRVPQPIDNNGKTLTIQTRTFVNDDEVTHKTCYLCCPTDEV